MKMKKIAITLFAGITFVAGAITPFGIPSASAASAPKQVEVLLDAKKIKFPDAQPFQDSNGYVMVPIRFVSEALGADVGWGKVNGKMSVSLQNEEHKVQMTVGQTTAVVDGETKTYETKIILRDDRTFVPLRLVGEGLGQTVEWDKVSRWVWIGKKDAISLEDKGLQPVSIDPYSKYFSKTPYLLDNPSAGTTFDQVLIFKASDLPTTLVRDIYSIERVDEKDGTQYLKIRSKTTSGAGNIYYLTKKGDIRYRNPVPSKTISIGDGTRYSFYKVWSPADKTIQGILDSTPLQLKDVEYIGFDSSKQDYIPLMVNPWRK